jgi:hypothetical protein
MASRAYLLAIAAASLLVSACGDGKVTTYRVPKEKDVEPPMAAAADAGGPADASAAPASGGSMADTSVPTASGQDLVWQAPPQWASKPAGAMRKATYSVPGEGANSDLSITAFPGDVGGELMNVNRWRGQLGLPPLRQEELDGSVSRVEANGLKMTLVELASQGDPGGKAMMGAIVPVNGSTWFFKLTGPGASIRSSKPAFLEFLHTVHAP